MAQRDCSFSLLRPYCRNTGNFPVRSVRCWIYEYRQFAEKRFHQVAHCRSHRRNMVSRTECICAQCQRDEPVAAACRGGESSTSMVSDRLSIIRNRVAASVRAKLLVLDLHGSEQHSCLSVFYQAMLQ